MMDYFIYLPVFIIGFAVSFHIIKSIQIEKIFRKGKISEIHVASFIISIIVGHLLADWALTIVDIFSNQ
ncbi:MAG: DUF1146 domain-containing protein [Candidatus Phytoplasma sp.]|nr:DUF1146 domain-containing protein [Phytoplasma sp.]